MSIDRMDLSYRLPRISERDLTSALSEKRMGGFIAAVAEQLNRVIEEVERRLNEQIAERLNHLLNIVNTDVQYFGAQDADGEWTDGTYRIAYDSDSGELQLTRYLDGSWEYVHRFLRES